ncbi:MAG: cotS 1, partial [Clostridia bacterium]|nr:cotS 1 [Clostridia bacterium]
MGFEIFTEEDRQKEREQLAAYDLDVDLFEKMDLKMKQIVPERNCFRIETNKGFYCLKKMNLSFEDIHILQEMTAHLKKNGFENIFDIVPQSNNEILMTYEGSQYYLTKWMDGRESDYLNLLDIKASIEALAKFHCGAEGFDTKYNTQHRKLYGRWNQGFTDKLREIEAAKAQILQKDSKSENTRIIVQYLESCERDANHAIKLLDKSSYKRLNARDEGKKGFIHHDFAQHNILHTFDNQTYIGGFESFAFDIKMHDLGYFLFKLMRRKGWDLDSILDLIGHYNDIYPLEKEDYEALAVYFAFPHDYKQFNRLYDKEGKDIGDMEELERVYIESEYNQTKKDFLIKFESY